MNWFQKNYYPHIKLRPNPINKENKKKNFKN